MFKIILTYCHINIVMHKIENTIKMKLIPGFHKNIVLENIKLKLLKFVLMT